MEFPITQDEIKDFKRFIELCQKDPNIVQHPELEFFSQYLRSLGKVPLSQNIRKEPEEDCPESEESKVKLHHEGGIKSDIDLPKTSGISENRVTAEEEKLSIEQEKRIKAIKLVYQGKYEEALSFYTEAISLYPISDLYVERGKCYLILNELNACIKDCSISLEINADNAAAYKFRGRANMLLGNFVKAAEDLKKAYEIHPYEEVEEWLEKITPKSITESTTEQEAHHQPDAKEYLEDEAKQSAEDPIELAFMKTGKEKVEIKLSKINYTKNYYVEDITDQPLMPKYQDVQERVNSFHKWKHFDDKEELVQMLADYGYYFSGGSIEPEWTKNLLSYIFCFSCGCPWVIGKYPVLPYQEFPKHHLDCQFIKCPQELFASIKPISDIFSRKKLCHQCSMNIIKVQCFPCFCSRLCAPCAKKTSNCGNGHTFEALSRVF